jgi:transposase-like protein
MVRRRYRAESIINRLREAEVLLAKGETVDEVCRRLGITPYTYDRWREEYGDLEVDQAKRLKKLERENSELKKVVADQASEIVLLKKASRGSP